MRLRIGRILRANRMNDVFSFFGGAIVPLNKTLSPGTSTKTIGSLTLDDLTLGLKAMASLLAAFDAAEASGFANVQADATAIEAVLAVGASIGLPDVAALEVAVKALALICHVAPSIACGDRDNSPPASTPHRGK
jgi:hypothetical protein